MKKHFLLASVVVILITSSCQPERNTPQSITEKFLKKITETADGQTSVYNLGYDANKRLVSIKNTDNTDSMIITYDATGNVIKMRDADTYYEHVLTYTYQNGIPVSGTNKLWTKHINEPEELIYDGVMTYTVANSQVIKIHVQLEPSTSGAANYNLSYTNGNLAKVELDGARDSYYQQNFTYGNKKSAFPKMSNFVLDLDGYSLLFCSKNELITASYDDGTGFDETITTQYTYDAKGYVLTSDNGDVHMKFEYE